MMKQLVIGLFASLLMVLMVLMVGLADATSEHNKVVTLKVLDYEIAAEVADTPATRSRGLMHRKTLAENSGMLFVFPKAGYYSMWMKDTSIPLSVAFIDADGLIINIAGMQPYTEVPHSAAGMAKYALEMNLGWFQTREIKSGAKITGLDASSR